MVIRGVQKLTLLDYPGKVAATVFSPGCNMRCPFCHNGTLVTSTEAGHLPEEDVLAFLRKRQGLLDGVCFTGGEPLLQKDILDFMKRVKELGYSIKLDSNGFLPDRLAEVIGSGAVDYIAMDIKNSPERYAVTAGLKIMDLSRITESISLIRSSGIDHEFRTTVVRQLHDEQSIEGAAAMVAGTGKYFLQNFVDSGDLIVPGMTGYTKAEMETLLEAARRQVPKAELRGV